MSVANAIFGRAWPIWVAMGFGRDGGGPTAISSAGRDLSAGSRDVAQLFTRYGPMVYSRARRLLGSHEDAEEAAQDIFIRVMTNADRIPTPSETVLWLSRITTNHCLGKLRDSRRRVELLETRVNPATSDRTEHGVTELAANVRALLARADERQATAAIYVFVDGMSHEEAADVLGVSKRTVGNLIDRFSAWAREQSGEPALRRAGGDRS